MQWAIVQFFFRLLNLFILVAAVLYLFKTKFLEVIQANIQKKLQYLRSFQQGRQEIIQQQENLDITIAQEHALMERLRSNVFQWNTVWQNNEKAQKNLQIKIESSIKETIRKQQYNRAQQKLQKKVAPIALNNSRKQLEKRFVHPEEQKKYLNALFDVLAQ